MKIILDLLIEIHKIEKIKTKIFFFAGPSETEKTFILNKISYIIGKKIPYVFSNGSFINVSGNNKEEFIIKLARKSIGVKFYQENLVIKGKLSNLEVKNANNSSLPINARIVLKEGIIEKTFEISEGLLKKILEKKIKLGDTIIINRTTGDIYCSHQNDLTNFKKQPEKVSFSGKNSFERIVITEQIINLDELDIVNQKKNVLKYHFGGKVETHDKEKSETLDVILSKWFKNNKIKIIKGLLIIDDVNLIDKTSYYFLKNLMLKFTCPSIVCFGNTEIKSFKKNKNIYTETIPIDFIKSCIVSMFPPLNCREFSEIIKKKCYELNLALEKNVLCFFVRICFECGLKYSLYILTITMLFSKKYNIDIKHIKRASNIFLNHKQSVLSFGNQAFPIFY